MDVRHVLEASIARGLGLTEDVVVAVVGIYMCPTDPECANNRERRRRRSRRLGESYVNNTEKISTPTPSTSNTKTSIYRRRHLLQDETWIEVQFNVIGPSSIVNVANERLQGNTTASSPTMTNPTTAWLPSYIAGNLSNSLGSAHGGLPDSLGFSIDSIRQGSSNSDNTGGNSGGSSDAPTKGVFDANDFDFGPTIPLEIDGEIIVLPYTPAPSPVVTTTTTTSTTTSGPNPYTPSTSLRPPSPSASNDTLASGPIDYVGMTVVVVMCSILFLAASLLGLYYVYHTWKRKRIERYLHHQRKKRDKRMKKRIQKNLELKRLTYGGVVPDGEDDLTVNKKDPEGILVDEDNSNGSDDDDGDDDEFEEISVSSSTTTNSSLAPKWMTCLDCIFGGSEKVLPLSFVKDRSKIDPDEWMIKYKKISPFLYSIDPKGKKPLDPRNAPEHPIWPPPPELRRQQLENLRLYKRNLISYELALAFTNSAKILQKMWRHSRVWGAALRLGLKRIHSARLIQRVWLGRMYGRKIWRARFDEVDGLHRAALRLQLSWYRRSGMYSTFVLMRALWVLDTREKNQAHLKHLRQRGNAARFVQYKWRRRRKMKKKLILLNAVSTVQRLWRTHASTREWRNTRNQLRELNAAAVRIQLAWYRRNGELSTYVLMRCLTWVGDQQEIKVAMEILRETAASKKMGQW